MKLTNFEGNVQYDLVEKNQLDQIIDDTAADSTNTTYSAQNIENKLATHTHDDRYYTENEIDTKLNNKLDKNVRFVDEGDFNDLIVVGKTTISILRTFGSALNAPIANIPGVYTVISNCSAVNGGTQLAIALSSNRIFTRTYLGGNDWRDWVEYVSKNAFVLEGTTLKITM